MCATCSAPRSRVWSMRRRGRDIRAPLSNDLGLKSGSMQIGRAASERGVRLQEAACGCTAAWWRRGAGRCAASRALNPISFRPFITQGTYLEEIPRCSLVSTVYGRTADEAAVADRTARDEVATSSTAALNAFGWRTSETEDRHWRTGACQELTRSQPAGQK